MKVLLLSDANNAHTIKWVEGLCNAGINVGLWSISKPKEGIYDNSRVKIYYTKTRQVRFSLRGKMKYLALFPHLRRAIQDFQPDILHAHYSSSFGLLGAISGFSPYIVSVWGADIYDFPKKNLVFRKLTKYTLGRADKILSTSHVMAKETSKYTSKAIDITPFGVDTEVFCNENKRDPSIFSVGTIKTLEKKYGIGYLIEAFSIFHDHYPNVKKRLIIVGGGSLEAELKKKTYEFGISELCMFTGRIPYNDVPLYHNMLDVCCCLSVMDSESFGVAAIESSAVGNPVVVSNVGGLCEVVKDQCTGIVIPSKNSLAAFMAIEKLYLDKDLRISMGKRGRERVKKYYEWSNNVMGMKVIYENILGK